MSDSASRPATHRSPAFLACAAIFGVYLPRHLVPWDVVRQMRHDANRHFVTPERRLGK